MPGSTLIQIGLLTFASMAGLVAGWLLRSRRSQSEKAAINAGWQEQILAQRNEHERLVGQNKSLMQQNSQYQASDKDSKMRAAELSSALKEAFERRDELQRKIKDIRSNLELAVREREQLQDDIEHRSAEVTETTAALRQRDETISRLSTELKRWQERVPPLVERFQARNQDALEFEEQLAEARERISAFEELLGSERTRVEPVDLSRLGEDQRASNEPIEHTRNANEAGAAADEAAVHEASQDDQDAAAPGRIGPGSGFGRDNLKLIKGVGPAIEKTLNEMGIWRFNQIASMSEYEIDRVAQRLKGFRSRVYREDWIGQARELQEQTASGQS